MLFYYNHVKKERELDIKHNIQYVPNIERPSPAVDSNRLMFTMLHYLSIINNSAAASIRTQVQNNTVK